MIFGMLDPDKKSHEISQICPPHLSDVATLPGKSKKSFSTVLFIRRKQTVIHLPTPPENVTKLTCELQNFFISLTVCLRFQTLEALKGASCRLSSVALKRTGHVVWQPEYQASNVTASVQSDHLLHLYMLPVFLDTDHSHSTPRCAEIQPMSQQAVAASLNMSVSIHVLLL